MVSFAPGTVNRSSFNTYSFINLLYYKLGALFLIFGELKAFYVLLLSLLTKVVILKNKFLPWFKSFLNYNIIIVLALILSFFIILISGKFDARVATGVELYSIILLLKVVNSFKFKAKLSTVSILSCLIIILFSIVIKYSIENYKNVSNVLNQVKQSNNEIILFEEIKYPSLIANYIHVPSYLGNLTINQNNFRNNSRPYLFLPYKLFLDIITNSEKIDNIKYQSDYLYYVIKDNNIQKNAKPYFKMRKPYENEIPLIYRPFSNRLDRFSLSEIEALQYQKIKVNNKYYYVIAKNPMIDSRVNNIIFR